MLLVIDIGNTNTSFGVIELGPRPTLREHVRSESARSRTVDEHAVLLHGMLSLRGVDARAIRHAIVASVVPALTERIVRAVKLACGVDTLVVGPGIKTGMPILYEDPREVGADRVVNAVAAYDWLCREHPEPARRPGCIVVDFGTATTFDCVTPKGEYLGGVICPGIEISADALFSRTARLRRVEIAPPPKVVGRNAVHSMQSGIVYGYAGLVDGLSARLVAELGHPCRVVATGGLAPLIAPLTSSIERVDDALTLEGLRLLWERNAAQA
jgi:type III pantothenate kinase